MALHDQSYKLLFSHPQMVRDLLDGFVREEWVAQLDLGTLEKVNASYVTGDLRARAGDMVWRVRWGDDWVYLYLLLEFQSTVERYMAVRILTYVGLLYEDLVRTRQIKSKGKLPTVFSIVLYNGKTRWYAPSELTTLIQPDPPLRCHPQVQYLLVDVRKCRQAVHSHPQNLALALFRLENSTTRRTVDAIVAQLLEWLPGPEHETLRRAFSAWLGRVIIARLRGAPLNKVVELQEMRTMLAERIDEWEAKLTRKSRREGRQKGRVEGGAELLLEQLQERFGKLPRWVLRRLRRAQLAELKAWGRNVFHAHNLEELLGTATQRPR